MRTMPSEVAARPAPLLLTTNQPGTDARQQHCTPAAGGHSVWIAASARKVCGRQSKPHGKAKRTGGVTTGVTGVMMGVTVGVTAGTTCARRRGRSRRKGEESKGTEEGQSMADCLPGLKAMPAQCSAPECHGAGRD